MIDLVLTAKGESNYITVSDLTVTVAWRSVVDLDLIAFHQKEMTQSTRYLNLYPRSSS